MAAIGISLGSSVVKIGLAELAAHSARLSDAKAENTAIPPAVAAFDADFRAIAAAYSNGQTDAAGAAAALAAVDQNIYANLHSLVGKVGTAWGAPTPIITNGAGYPCNSKCTASCCLFTNDLHPAIVVAIQGLNGVTPSELFLKTSTGFVVTVPEVYPPDDSAYGDFTRPSYQVTFNASPISDVQSNLLSNVSELLGKSPTTSASGTTSLATSNITLLLGFGVILLFIALFLGIRK